MEARHVGRRPSLVDEDETLRVESGLAIEPVLAPLQNVRPVLLGRVRRLFLRVMPRRLKKRQSVLRPAPMPFSASRSCSSERIMSGFSSTSERISSAWAPERRSPPSGFGLKSPSRRSRSFQRIALDALTPNGLPPYGTIFRHRQPQEPVREDQSIELWPCMLAPFTSMQLESDLC